MSRQPLLLSAIVRNIGLPNNVEGYDDYVSFVQAMEQGGFDIAFFPDVIGNNLTSRFTRGDTPQTLDPLVLAAALATRTSNIGLVATVNTNLSYPYSVARQIASLDHVSRGRIGWNIVSSLSENARRAFGIEEIDHAARYARAEEFVDIVRRLWLNSVDPATGGGLGQPAVEYQGRHLQTVSLSDVPAPPQRLPVLFQAGASETGIDFSTRYADVVYTASATLEDASTTYADLRRRVRAHGRDPDQFAIVRGLFFFAGNTAAEAQGRYASFVENSGAGDDTLLRERYFRLFGADLSGLDLDAKLVPGTVRPTINLGRWTDAEALALRESLSPRELYVRFVLVRGHQLAIGTGGDIAAHMDRWYRSGAVDGYNVKIDSPEELERFVALVVPELRRRGALRPEGFSGTLRERLGLKPVPQ